MGCALQFAVSCKTGREYLTPAVAAVLPCFFRGPSLLAQQAASSHLAQSALV